MDRRTDNANAYLPPHLRPYSYPTFSPYNSFGYGSPTGYPLPYPPSSTTMPPTNYFSRPLPSVTSIPTPSPSASPEESDEDAPLSPPAKKTPPPLPELPILFRPIQFDDGAQRSASPRELPPTPDSDTHSEAASEGTSSISSAASATSGPQSFLVSIPRLTSSKLTKGDLTLSLLDSELWKSFHSVGNEMIVTKPGR